jgi:hypothetical protein
MKIKAKIRRILQYLIVDDVLKRYIKKKIHST